jgi:excinuclease ABC subunit C
MQGKKWELLMMAQKNARESLEQSKRHTFNRMGHDPTRALLELQESLDLPEFPARMECYDISHVQGSHTVASMVVFTDGKPDKQNYKRFKIKCAEGRPDDFQSMAEVIRRRFSHGTDESGWDEPNLVIIDGGKGQLGAAVDALRSLEIYDQPIISLAKKFEEVYLPNRSRPVILSRDSMALFLLQQIRDEAHRFAITYHRNLRAKAGIRSSLDEVKGIGLKRKKQLLDYFGTVEKIRAASPQELGQVLAVSIKVAEKIYEALHAENPARISTSSAGSESV